MRLILAFWLAHGRHKADRLVNRCMKTVFRNGVWVQVRSQDIRVGDLVKVSDDEQCPVDMILVASSDAKGLSYVETGASALACAVLPVPAGGFACVRLCYLQQALMAKPT